MEHGRSGYLVNTMDEALAAVADLDNLPRARVRECFEQRFTSRHMAQSYVELFDAAIGGEQKTDRKSFLLRA
jgi:hypothetical protein